MRRSPLPALFLLLLGAVALPVSAQTNVIRWFEVGMPRDSVFVDVSAAAQRPAVDYFLRSGQQYVQFYRKPGTSLRARVSIDGGVTWQDVQGASSQRTVNWHTPPTQEGFYPVVFQWDDYGNWHTYYLDFYVVRAANRMFKSSNYTTITGSGIPQTIRRDQMLLWSLGSETYTQQDRPMLVVEGIDAENKNSAATYLALGSNTQGTRPALFPISLANGADVSILDFADGGADMAFNAQVVKGAVRFWSERRSRPNVGFGVAGVSMGGVVARYALAEMEGEREEHGVAHFVSLDAPQRGAVIDGRLQRDIKILSDADSDLKVPRALTSPAALQLLPNAAFDASSPTMHTRFYAQLRALNGGIGYPAKTDNIGVSFGAPIPPTTQGQTWLRLDVPNIPNVIPSKWGFCGTFLENPICPDKDYDLSGPVAGAGSRLPKDIANQWGWGLFLNFFSYELDRAGRPDPVFIPYGSALDEIGGGQAFDARFDADSTRYHDRVPSEIVLPVLSRMGYLTPPPPPPPLAVNLDGPYAVTASSGVWFGWVNRPRPHGFALSWRYRLDLNGACDEGGMLRTSRGKKSGDVTPNLINQCEWYTAPQSDTFRYSVAANAWLDIELTARSATQTLVATRRVRIGSGGGGGGPLAAAQAEEAEAQEERVEAFEVTSLRPSAVRSGERVRVGVVLPEASEVDVAVYDVLGRVQQRRTESVGRGRQVVEITSEGFPAGVYLVVVHAGIEHRTVRFIVH